MGNWNISIHGVGAHHNELFEKDANRMAAQFVEKLREAGHSVASATITFGSEESVVDGVRYCQQRDEIEKASFAARAAQAATPAPAAKPAEAAPKTKVPKSEV